MIPFDPKQAFAPKRQPRLKPKKEVKSTPTVDGQKVVFCFGPPYVGTSSVVSIVAGATEVANVVIDAVDLPGAIQEAQAALKELDLIIVDIPGGLLTPADVEAVYAAGLVSAAEGAFVRFYAPVEQILHRLETNGVEDYATEEDLTEWNKTIVEVEDVIRLHNIPYFMIPNDNSLEQSAIAFAIRLGLKK